MDDIININLSATNFQKDSNKLVFIDVNEGYLLTKEETFQDSDSLDDSLFDNCNYEKHETKYKIIIKDITEEESYKLSVGTSFITIFKINQRYSFDKFSDRLSYQDDLLYELTLNVTEEFYHKNRKFTIDFESLELQDKNILNSQKIKYKPYLF